MDPNDKARAAHTEQMLVNQRTEVMVELRGGKIVRWLVIDANRAGFPGQGELGPNDHLVSNGGGWHYTDVSI